MSAADPSLPPTGGWSTPVPPGPRFDGSFALHLPYPSGGVNRLYRVSRGQVHKRPESRAWQDDALLLARRCLKSLPEGHYWISLEIVIWTIAQDADAPVKAAIDVIAAALNVNDGYVAKVTARKVRVFHRKDQRLEVSGRIIGVGGWEEWNTLGRDWPSI